MNASDLMRYGATDRSLDRWDSEDRIRICWVRYATVPIGFHTGALFRTTLLLFVPRFFIFISNIASLMPRLGVRLRNV